MKGNTFIIKILGPTNSGRQMMLNSSLDKPKRYTKRLKSVDHKVEKRTDNSGE